MVLGINVQTVAVQKLTPQKTRPHNSNENRLKFVGTFKFLKIIIFVQLVKSKIGENVLIPPIQLEIFEFGKLFTFFKTV